MTTFQSRSFRLAASLSAGFLLILGSQDSHARDAYVGTQVAARMIQDGKMDNDRLFVFYFTYLDKKTCMVQSLTFNNLSCKSEASALTSRDAFWVKPEVCSADWCGDKFQCNAQRMPDQSVHLVVTTGDGITHRLTVNEFNKVLDYAGTLSKHSSITNKIETAQYLPVRGKTGLSFEELLIGCRKVTVPVVATP